MEETLTRSVPFTVERSDSSDGLTLSGYAAVFDTPTRINERGMEFDETIAPGAFARAINARERTVLQFEHGKHPFFGSLPIGRIDSMREDERGLYVEATLSDNWMVQPVRDAIRDQAVTGMSFRFSVPDGGDVWDHTGETTKRTINEVKLYELGPVVFPAYEATTVGVRSALGLLSEEERAELIEEFSPTPDEGSEESNTVTPDEGSRLNPHERSYLLRDLEGVL